MSASGIAAGPDPMRPLSTHPDVLAVDSWTPTERETHATDPTWVHTKAQQLPPEDFAHLAAALMVTTTTGVEQPISATRETRRVLADMLRNTDLTTQLLLDGRARIIIIPRHQRLTDTPEFAHLAGTHTPSGDPWDTTRGITLDNGLLAIGEENVLGTTSTLPTHTDGYSTLTHEIAHTLHHHLHTT
ncbi:hypothetical protein, partial [Streptomyces lonarensis]|uniref:hypothetical protein n=1 Tax=Streptomyces lonarensis TaxID=700599 RepID=UPI0030C6B719